MFPRSKRGAVAGLAAIAALAACTPEPTPPADVEILRLEPAGFADLPGWQRDDPSAAVRALVRSCRRLARRDDSATVGPDGRFGTAADWKRACDGAEAAASGADAARAYLEARFSPWRAFDDRPGNDLFTGYFEPVLQGSRTRSPGYAVPVHARPDDLVLVDLGLFRDSLKGERIAGRVQDGRLQPFDSRADIVAGSLKDAPAILYLADPIDAFFLHIQGSGLVQLDDGTWTRVGYDGHNGHVYYAIGRWLIDQGYVAREDMSLQAIRDWLRANPDRQDELMNKNPSYIFFRELRGDGPIGAEGVALTPGRSLAVDRRFLGLGIPVYVDIDYSDEAGAPLQRLMVAQDTGGAIRGAVRGDVFWGAGPPAEALAGPMAAKGRTWLLLPRGLRPAAP